MQGKEIFCRFCPHLDRAAASSTIIANFVVNLINHQNINHKKILFCFVLLFGWALSLSAQDIITTKDGTDIQVKILEITPYEVKYKKYDNLNGPIFSMLKSQILIVRYENGGNEIFGPKRYNDGGYLNTAETVSLAPEIHTAEVGQVWHRRLSLAWVNVWMVSGDEVCLSFLATSVFAVFICRE